MRPWMPTPGSVAASGWMRRQSPAPKLMSSLLMPPLPLADSSTTLAEVPNWAPSMPEVESPGLPELALKYWKSAGDAGGGGVAADAGDAPSGEVEAGVQHGLAEVQQDGVDVAVRGGAAAAGEEVLRLGGDEERSCAVDGREGRDPRHCGPDPGDF